MQTSRWLLLSLALIALMIPSLHAAKGKKIDEVVLKENPTKKDVAAYLDELAKAVTVTTEKSANRTFSHLNESKELNQKLAQVPSSHIDVVIQRAKKMQGERGSIMLMWALVDSVKDRTDLDASSREAIIDGIREYPVLAYTVVRMDWIKGSEAKLLKLAKSSNPNGSRRFIELVAKIDTPEARKLLPELMLRGHSFSVAECFKVALEQDLPWLEPEPLVLNAWKKIKAAPGRTTWDDPMHFAAIAARFGETDALIMIAKLLNGAANQNTERDASVRQQLKDATFTLQQTIDADVLDTKSLVKFVLDNRDSLVFDKATRKYRVK
jgi:hypothetical protein